VGAEPNRSAAGEPSLRAYSMCKGSSPRFQRSKAEDTRSAARSSPSLQLIPCPTRDGTEIRSLTPDHAQTSGTQTPCICQGTGDGQNDARDSRTRLHRAMGELIRQTLVPSVSVPTPTPVMI
jgi:hypothetical protein